MQSGTYDTVQYTEPGLLYSEYLVLNTSTRTVDENSSVARLALCFIVQQVRTEHLEKGYQYISLVLQPVL